MRPPAWLAVAVALCPATVPPLDASPHAMASGGQDVPAVIAPALAGEILSEIRVHGNYATPDEVVRGIAGLVVGQRLGPGAVEQAAERLRKSGRFAQVEIRTRSRSLDGADLVLVIIVTEHDGAGGGDAVPIGPPSLARRLTSSLMFLPVLDYTDGYGVTYGARFTFAGALGRHGRASVPLTWGGTRRAAAEMEWPIGGAPGPGSEPVVRVSVVGGWSSRENPHFDVVEARTEVGVGVSRGLTHGVRAGGRAGLVELTFGGYEDRLITYGADLVFDTRVDPSFPRNAAFARVAWDGADGREAGRFNRYLLEGHGYVGLLGKSVLAVGARHDRADRALPAYAQPLLGGADTLRGFRPGRFAADNLFAASAELRVPFSSPLSVGTTGFAVFADVGASYAHGVPLRDAAFERGVGAGLFVMLPVGSARVDVARGIGSGNRAHVSFGVRF